MTPLEGEILQDAEENIKKNEAKVRRGFWKTLAKASKHIPFLQELVAGYYCALDPDTPNRVRAVLLAALGYFVLPLDAIPDFLVGFGFTDDIAVLGAVLSSIRTNIKQKHTDLARSKLAQLQDIDENH